MAGGRCWPRLSGIPRSSTARKAGIPNPRELDLLKPQPLAAFECGRNKKAVDLLRYFDAAAEHEGPESADITKLAREIDHKDLPYGYALEFYDKDQGEASAKELIRRLRLPISNAESDRLRVVVLVCISGRGPMLTMLPAAWDKDMRLRFGTELKRVESLICAAALREDPANRKGYTNRVTREAFLTSCSTPARTLIEAVEQRLGDRVAVSGELAKLTGQSNRKTSRKIEVTQNFGAAVVSAIDRACNKSISKMP